MADDKTTVATVDADAMMDTTMAPSLAELVAKRSLKWIFVGGKGGVGKTTTSCCLAVQLSKVRDNVLLISTDPAHNLSDAFNQKFTKEPSPVAGFRNLFAMEVDPTLDQDEMASLAGGQANSPAELSIVSELATAIPGVDEAMSFAQVMKLVQTMHFSTIVFDTAPTGHTLRFLSFPSTLDKALSRLSGLSSRMGGLFTMMQNMMRAQQPGGAADAPDAEDMMAKLEKTRAVIEEVNRQFKDADMTTFVCVCIPEFLSVYETERMIQELTKFEIDVQNVVVNQIVYPERRSDPSAPSCALCEARHTMQSTYLAQIEELYDLYHIVRLPLLKREVRGLDRLELFGRMLVEPYSPDDAKSSELIAKLNDGAGAAKNDEKKE